MSDPGCLIAFGALVIGGFVVATIGNVVGNYSKEKLKLNKEISERREEVEKVWRDFQNQMEKRTSVWERQVQEDKRALDVMVRQKSLGFPWLADAFADYEQLRDMKIADQLESKKHPAQKSADTVRGVAVARRRAEQAWRLLKYQLHYYETLFPWLEDYKEERLDEQIRQILEGSQQPDSEDEEDPVSHYMTRSEFLTLSIEERNQLALDRYWNKKKTSWELGRDYERFVGYRYETKGWNIQYHGIMEGFADLGRDLIASKSGETQIVQCKYWSQGKIIHEKHIFQLYGTVFAYRLDHPSEVVSGVFVTSTTLSDTAMKFAVALGLDIQERVPFGRYPCIKCNVSHRDGGKIYHLPFDQQYDRTFIDPARGERYVMTVSDAQEAGFRRAYRWKGPGKLGS